MSLEKMDPSPTDAVQKSEDLTFKIFQPRKPSLSLCSDSLSLTPSSNTSGTGHFPFPSHANAEDQGRAFNFDFTSFRGPPTNLTSNNLRGYSGDPNLPKRLHVSNIPFRYREHNLVMLFGKFGNVEDAEIIYNDKGSKGFGFVTMSRGQDADNALIRLNHAIVEGRIIEVNLATPKVNTMKRVSGAVVPGTYRRFPGPPQSKELMEAESHLAQARSEVLKLRKQMQMFNYFKSAEVGNFKGI